MFSALSSVLQFFSVCFLFSFTWFILLFFCLFLLFFLFIFSFFSFRSFLSLFFLSFVLSFLSCSFHFRFVFHPVVDTFSSILSHACIHSAVHIERSSRSLARQASACVLHWPGHVLPLAELAMFWASHGQSLRVSQGWLTLSCHRICSEHSDLESSHQIAVMHSTQSPLLSGLASACPCCMVWHQRQAPGVASEILQVDRIWVMMGYVIRANLWLIFLISSWYRQDMVFQCCSCPYLWAAFFCGGFWHPLQADCRLCRASFSFTTMTGTPWADKAALHLLRWPVRRSLTISFCFPCIAKPC